MQRETSTEKKRRADMKAFNEMMERREAGRKAYEEKMMSEWKADRKKKEIPTSIKDGQVESRQRKMEG
jgi:hypothetical protein